MNYAAAEKAIKALVEELDYDIFKELEDEDWESATLLFVAVYEEELGR